MKFTISSIILAGLATAQLILTNSDYNGIEAGEPFEITWSGAGGPVTLNLMNGPADDLSTVSEITSGLTGESFTWTPPESLPSGTYAFEISDGSEINYSPRFRISGGAASGSSTVSLTTTTMSASSTSSVSSATSATSTSVVTSTASSNTTSTVTSESSSSATMSSNSSSITGSVTISSATTTMTTTRTSSRISATTSSGTPDVTEVPGTNGVQGVVAPLVAPLLVAVGAALF
ncbi:hypothetical protein DL770_004269 [Monosporascus sp. CRB-9-2]|nr:hypothetical protein DL770_004269 [Monosporascus sp. CRB-9-2]